MIICATISEGIGRYSTYLGIYVVNWGFYASLVFGAYYIIHFLILENYMDVNYVNIEIHVLGLISVTYVLVFSIIWIKNNWDRKIL